MGLSYGFVCLVRVLRQSQSNCPDLQTIDKKYTLGSEIFGGFFELYTWLQASTTEQSWALVVYFGF